ncbi:uncharacterized protein LOC111803666 [Cucurbita pepo subsp. pepo]|uniref:uncharacterized protein LOC111803666 n=1 Tax=Cucurbita pepo subsp. pepo TaxID=3664 RepID=UPI000C9D2BB7|nr:uncharacterized protein LOC111803666 [Cucurbita pepo subsp. pepo]
MKQSVKPISSPSRIDLFPPPLMSFLRADAGNRSKSGRSRSSPIFIRKKNVAIETQEPSSPKVTCMGQVRTNKRSSRPPAKRCRWIRSVLSFNRRHCRTFWNRSTMFFQGKREIRRKSSITESRVRDEAEDSEQNEESEGAARDEVFASSAPSPPKNALILTRCRSAPHRSSFYGNRYEISSIRSDRAEEEEGEGEKTEHNNGNGAASKNESQNSERMFRKLENSNGEEDRSSVNNKESKIEENSMSNRSLILTRCKSEPGRIREELYG